MFFTKIFPWIMMFAFVYDMVKLLRKKRFAEAFCVLWMLPFCVFMLSSFILGGSAAKDAAINYEQYVEGHYYLVSHGSYKEVSYEAFRYMSICKAVAIPCFFVGFVLTLFGTSIRKWKM